MTRWQRLLLSIWHRHDWRLESVNWRGFGYTETYRCPVCGAVRRQVRA